MTINNEMQSLYSSTSAKDAIFKPITRLALEAILELIVLVLTIKAQLDSAFGLKHVVELVAANS
jgi:hypothetical protein